MPVSGRSSRGSLVHERAERVGDQGDGQERGREPRGERRRPRGELLAVPPRVEARVHDVDLPAEVVVGVALREIRGCDATVPNREGLSRILTKQRNYNDMVSTRCILATKSDILRGSRNFRLCAVSHVGSRKDQTELQGTSLCSYVVLPEQEQLVAVALTW